MNKYTVAVWIGLASLWPALASAQQPAQLPVYFSNFNGHQVLSVDGLNGGTPTVVFSGSQIGSATFSPEDMVVGPDAKLYICDSLNSQIWRFDPTVGVGPGNPQVVVRAADLPPGVYPEGPTFSGSDDLYFNTRGAGLDPSGDNTGAAGVWVVSGVATPGTTAPYIPQRIIQSVGSNGEGTVVEALGNLLVVDQSGNRVLSVSPHQTGSAFDFGPGFSELITNIPAPIGIAVDTCGDVLVASGNAIQRYSVTKGSSSGAISAQFQNTYVNFGRGNVVSYFERDASNNLFVGTNSTTAGGMMWRVSPNGSDPIGSCSTGTATLLVALKKFTTGSTPLLANPLAVGVAIPPTAASVTRTFTPSAPSATFNFGHYQLTVTYTQVYNTFSQTFTATMSRPHDVQFNGSFAPGTVGLRFPSLGGFVVQFITASQGSCTSFASCGVPVAGVDYFTDPTGTTPAFLIDSLFHDPLQPFSHTGLAHSSTDTQTGVYTDDVTHDFWILLDQGTRGTGSIWGSKYVVFNEPFQVSSNFVLPLQVQLTEPALKNNPLFNIGQNVTVAIIVTDQRGVAVPGLTLRLSAARTSPLPVVLQVVEATNNATEQNILNDNGNGKYSIQFDSSSLTAGPGTYQMTISGTGFSPVLPATPLPFYLQFTKSQ